MRDILFRGEDIKAGEWVRGAAVKNAVGNGYYILRRDRRYGVQQETLGQYTGLDDKNGKPIFEGDIVTHVYPEFANGVIKWADEKAMFILRADPWCTDFDHIDCKDIEIVGNIYDNPESLKNRRRENE